METPQTYNIRTIETGITPDQAQPRQAHVRIPICNAGRQIVAYGAGDTVTQATANAEAIASAFETLTVVFRLTQLLLDHATDETTNWRDLARCIRDKAASVLYPEASTP